MTQEARWANPGALGLAGFGFNTILLQLHNIGLISNVEPLLYGFFWGGLAQVIAGIIDGRRGDTFGLTAFTSYGLFWIGLTCPLYCGTINKGGFLATDSVAVWAEGVSLSYKPQAARGISLGKSHPGHINVLYFSLTKILGGDKWTS